MDFLGPYFLGGLVALGVGALRFPMNNMGGPAVFEIRNLEKHPFLGAKATFSRRE